MQTVDDVLFFLKAKSPQGLRVLMARNNIKKRTYHTYQIIFAEGFWYAWYEGSRSEELESGDIDVSEGQRTSEV